MTLKNRFYSVATALAFGLALLSSVSNASAPQQKTQAPGYYRMMLGKFEVTVLSDGSSPLPVDKLLTNIAPAQIDLALEKAALKAPVDTSTNAFLINTGSKLVLIDTGFGSFFGPTQGKLLSNLKAAGYQADQVDEIYITHMHGDHVGGLIADGKTAFPNAIVRADQREADFWLNTAHMNAAPEELKQFFQTAMSTLKPYIAAGRFKPFNGDIDLAPGIRAKFSPGHTAGHTVYVVQSGSDKLVIWGDLVHVAAIQFANPSVAIRFDLDSPAAAAARTQAFADASDGHYWVAGAHIPFPGIGQVRKEGAGFVFVPANYQSVP
jgi:glyoxylase-like metal-dependent hydrolase (beta-lactamase superfamily II)